MIKRDLDGEIISAEILPLAPDDEVLISSNANNQPKAATQQNKAGINDAHAKDAYLLERASKHKKNQTPVAEDVVKKYSQVEPDQPTEPSTRNIED